jgi:hypothetical protein
VPFVVVQFEDGKRKSITMPSDIMDEDDTVISSLHHLSVGQRVAAIWENVFYDADVIEIHLCEGIIF